MSNRVLMFFLTLAIASLVLNDVARLSFPSIFQLTFTQSLAGEEKQDDNPPANTLFEEEVKHKTFRECMDWFVLPGADELDAAVAHLIADDDVRHLAFLPIFSPPPNRA